MPPATSSAEAALQLGRTVPGEPSRHDPTRTSLPSHPLPTHDSLAHVSPVAPPRAPRVRAPFLAALLLTLYFVMAVSASLTKSATFDEIVHVTAGYNAWLNHDQRFDPGNGDFVKRWATLPLLVTRPTFPPLEGDAWRRADFFPFSRDFLFHSGNDPDALLAQSRAMVALIGVALGALIFLCARELFGSAAALVSLALYAFCPHFLAHGALVSTDLTLTFALLASTWFLWRLLHRVTWPNLLASLLALALLVVSKMSAVLIVPIAGVLVLTRLVRAIPLTLHLPPTHPRILATRRAQLIAILLLALTHILTAWAAIWTTFEFKYHARAHAPDSQISNLESHIPATPAADTHLALLRTPDAEVTGVIGHVAAFCHHHRLLPEGYLKGMAELVGISQRRPSFMHGEWHTGGRLAFFPYAFWAKTSPALLALLALGLLGAGALAFSSSQRHRVAARLYAATPLFTLFIIYAAVALTQTLNIGHRHILPLYPALLILAGSVALFPTALSSSAARIRIPFLVTPVLLLAWHAAESLRARPHYLAYFSPLVGGPAHGYQHLADSSLDWGQDLPALKHHLDTHNSPTATAPARTVYLSYFGTADPQHYDIASWRLPGFPEWRDLQVFPCTPGIYAISATMFQQLYSMTFGPWNRVYEDEYQAHVARLGLTPANTATRPALIAALQQHPDAVWQEFYGRYEKLRFARLCAWLRATGRAPDAQIGHSILIFHLDTSALHAALWSPPLELLDAPVR